MDLTTEHIASKKIIGKLKKKDVFHIETTGGLNLVIASKDGAFVTLGAGPHRAVARFIAQRSEPGIEWTELSKADWIDPNDIPADMLSKYETLTKRFRVLGK